MTRISKVVGGLTMSLDGFVSDAARDIRRLYPDLAALRGTEWLQASIRDTGAAVMGRRTYDMFEGDVTGYEYQVPIFVVTHDPPATPPRGTNDRLSVTFVPEGPAEAVRLARDAAKGKDVTVVAGPDLLSQLMRAGLVDELDVGIVPILLGDGLRMFGELRDLPPLRRIRVVESPGRTDIVYQVVREKA